MHCREVKHDWAVAVSWRLPDHEDGQESYCAEVRLKSCFLSGFLIQQGLSEIFRCQLEFSRFILEELIGDREALNEDY